jgi:hypothetical protein
VAYKKIWDIKKTNVNIGTGEDAFPVEGLISVSCARNEDEYTTRGHVAGGGRNTRNNDVSGTITVVLEQSSATHDLIMLLHKSGVQFPIAILDKTSTAGAAFGDGCVLSKPPDFEREQEAVEVEYVFTCIDLQINHSGAADE